jgi:hypothetical protein
MRRLHQNHGAAAGPFSICVHRDDAATLSYTEVEVTSRELVMRYRPGQPCGFARQPGWFETASLPLHQGIPKRL